MIDWADIFEDGNGPKYRQPSDRIAAAIMDGRLPTGTRLPSHRDLAYKLGVSIGSVARAHGELIEQRLVRGEVGRATIVQTADRSGRIGLKRSRELVDLRLVLRPAVNDELLIDDAGRRTMRALGDRWPLLSLGEFPSERGDARHRKAAETWLAGWGVPTSDHTVMIMIGAPEALASSLLSLTRRGDVVLAESVTIASLRSLGDTLGLQLCRVGMDNGGLLPDELGARARQRRANVLVVQPTLQIPSGVRMSEGRRRGIVEVARAEGLTVIEYEGWSSVVPGLASPLAQLAPERVVYIDAFSNALMPGLRTSIVRIPPELTSGILAARHGILLSTPSVLSEIATHWISSGVAIRLATAISAKNRQRMKIARKVLGRALRGTPDESPLIWLPVAPFPNAAEFASAAGEVGVKVLPSDSFAIDGEPPPYVRVALSSAESEEQLEGALNRLADLLQGGTDITPD